MRIYPAIDLKDGRCVRLIRGDMDTDTIYNDNPANQAKQFEEKGFEYLHIVDLNGAIEGRPVNENAVLQIISAINIPVQLGGGIRNMTQIEKWITGGVSRVILGTAAVKNPNVVVEACLAFPGKIAVGIDACNGMASIEGWLEATEIKAIDLAKKFEDAGACAIIYTDIERDGTGLGLNLDSTAELAKGINIPVIASGGVGSLNDLEKLKHCIDSGSNIEGVIIGKAFYEGKIDPIKALAFCS